MKINDQLMQALKDEAARQGTTENALIEAAIQLVLTRRDIAPLPRLPIWDSGGLQIDVADRGALFDAI